MSRPSNTFLSSHLAGEAQRERDNIAWHTTKILVVLFIIALIITGVGLRIHHFVRDYQCDRACISTGVMDSGFSEIDPNKIIERYCVCASHLLLERVSKARDNGRLPLE